MINRAHRLRFRRKVRMHKRQMETAGAQTDQYVFRRLERLTKVRRFVASWVMLVVVVIFCSVIQISSLSNYYQELLPASGGAYTEGVIGAFTNANPVYATSTADRTVSKLLFSGLLKYDEHNKLVGDLAESWQADSRGAVYTVKLHPHLKWSDGKPLTTADVLFTYSVIQNADAGSPLASSWQGVKVEANDARTVVFTLSNPLASFPYSLTNGIIPRHVLESVPMGDMRSTAFNTNQPVGSGPFRWQNLAVSGTADTREERITLEANDLYHKGKPKLDMFIIRTFRNETQIAKSYNEHELNAMVGLAAEAENMEEKKQLYSFPQTAAMMTFFKTTGGVLADKTVRQALTRATDTKTLRRELPYVAQPVDAPLLKGQLGYDKEVGQLPYDLTAAQKQLDEAGWTVPKPGGVREKAGQKLEFTLYAESGNEAARVTQVLQQQWRKVGANVKVELQSGSDFQVTLSEHSYDALLRGISIGNDPDVFVYWHSSQADVLSSSRLNFSEYKSDIVDEALESARTRTDANLRTAKYKPFLAAWRDDAPAIGLYQPRFLYIVRDTVYGLKSHEVVSASDRFANVDEWQIRLVKTTVD
jgi:peptide/nickel transport system substrate-binding protein